MLHLFKKKKETNHAHETLILYGSKTGNAKMVANELKKYSKTNNIHLPVENMSSFHPHLLPQLKKVIVVVSTHDDGMPPNKARKFYKKIHSSEMPKLNGLEFAICGLGDSSYEKFCEAAKMLEKRFVQLGATAILPRKDCDEDFGESAAKWICEVIRKLEGKTDSSPSQNISADSLKQNNSFSGEIVASEKLGEDCYEKETYHIEINHFNKPITFHPGDLIEITPVNPKLLVDSMAKKLSVKRSLIENKEISSLSEVTVKAYALEANNKDLHKLISKPKKLNKFISKGNALDLYLNFPSSLNASTFIRLLPPLQKRQYSIANFQRSKDDALHLMVKTIRFSYKDSIHEGAASVYLNESIHPGDKINFKLISVPDFYLPEDKNAPIIFLANGTGYAPVRGLLQQWQTEKYKSKVWVIWGEQKHRAQHKYYKELLELSQEFPEIQFQPVSSREESQVKYIQDVLQLHAAEFSQFIKDGAHVFICGSKNMGQDAIVKMDQILHRQSNSLTIDQLTEQDRLHCSIY